MYNNYNPAQARIDSLMQQRQMIDQQIQQVQQSANIINTLQPTPKPAYITCSPYYAYNNGCGCNGYNNL